MSKQAIEDDHPVIARQPRQSTSPAYTYVLLATFVLPLLLVIWPAYIALPVAGALLVVVMLVRRGRQAITPASTTALILAGLLIWSLLSVRYARILNEQGDSQAGLWYVVALGLFGAFLLSVFMSAMIHRRTRKNR
jgi:drug/metabolite transporter (DMT)-like permease